jgi:hypothetical protein
VECTLKYFKTSDIKEKRSTVQTPDFVDRHRDSNPTGHRVRTAYDCEIVAQVCECFSTYGT